MPEKKLTDYIEDTPAGWPDALAAYPETPASAFLTELIHLCDSVNHCRRLFTKTQTGNYTKDSRDSLYRIQASTLAAAMGHFETFQRFLFAGVIEATRLIPVFDFAECCKKLEKDAGLSIDLPHMFAYRGQPAPVGQLVSDSLPGWHDPHRVNRYYKAVLPDLNFYAKAEAETLRTLWQMRHTIVHTGGWLTQPDAQKVTALNDFGDQPILLGGRFTETAGRRLHRIVRLSVDRLRTKFRAELPSDLESYEKIEIKKLFQVRSPRMSWF